jgi:hypothetical protein
MPWPGLQQGVGKGATLATRPRQEQIRRGQGFGQAQALVNCADKPAATSCEKSAIASNPAHLPDSVAQAASGATQQGPAAAMADTVEKRRVIHVGGYDPMPPDVLHRRFCREIRRFEKTWNVTAEVGPLTTTEDEAIWHVTVTGPGWQVTSEHRALRWDDVINADRDRSNWSRLPLGVLSFLDFVWHGALWHYLRTAWRYAGFFLYPFVLIAGLAGSAYGAASLLTGLVGWPALWPLAAVPAFIALVALLGKRLQLDHLLDDWIFSMRLLRRQDPVLGPRLERIAAWLGAEAAARPATETIVVGHSLGAVIAVDLLDMVVARQPEGSRLGFASIGASILKIGFHRKAMRLKDGLSRIASSSRLFWVDYQALNDVMNFYKSKPLKLLGLKGQEAVTQIARIRRMLEPAIYNKISLDFFRLHCQFISGNDRRAGYDYFMMICGPFPLPVLAHDIDGAMHRIDEQGHIIAPAQEHA